MVLAVLKDTMLSFSYRSRGDLLAGEGQAAEVPSCLAKMSLQAPGEDLSVSCNGPIAGSSEKQTLRDDTRAVAPQAHRRHQLEQIEPLAFAATQAMWYPAPPLIPVCDLQNA